MLRGHRSKFLNSDVLMSIKFVFVTANSADSDEIQCYVAFHLGFHCLPKYLFTRMKRVNTLFFSVKNGNKFLTSQ